MDTINPAQTKEADLYIPQQSAILLEAKDGGDISFQFYMNKLNENELIYLVSAIISGKCILSLVRDIKLQFAKNPKLVHKILSTAGQQLLISNIESKPLIGPRQVFNRLANIPPTNPNMLPQTGQNNNGDDE